MMYYAATNSVVLDDLAATNSNKQKKIFPVQLVTSVFFLHPNVFWCTKLSSRWGAMPGGISTRVEATIKIHRPHMETKELKYAVLSGA